MPSIVPQTLPPRNRLLASLPSCDLAAFRSCFVRVPLVCGQLLADHGFPVDYAYFIEHGVVSILSSPEADESGVQVAMIGREGLVGDLALVDMRHPARARAIVHVPGSALRISGADLRRAIERSPALRSACSEFVQSMVAQVMQTAASNARRSLAERCARWLVMTLERVEGNEVRVTHEALSEMLGMRRSGVTLAAGILQDAGLIRTGRGRITVLEVAQLRAVSQGNLPVSSMRPDAGLYGAHVPVAETGFEACS